MATLPDTPAAKESNVVPGGNLRGPGLPNQRPLPFLRSLTRLPSACYDVLIVIAVPRRTPMTAKPTAAYMIPVVEATPAVIRERIESFVKIAQAMVDGYHDKNYPNIPRDVLEVSYGPRYAKIISRTPGSGSVWAFIDLSNGDILKPASFRVPAKHARGTVLAVNYGVDCCGPHGPRYLK